MARHKEWSVGDVFAIKTSDNRFAVGQVVGREAKVLNSVSVALFDQQCDRAEDAVNCDLSASRVYSVLFTTRDLLDSGVWSVVGKKSVLLPKEALPYEATRASGFVGAKVIGSATVGKFADAYFGLAPWNLWKDPQYLDKLLISPDKKPKQVVLQPER